MTNTFGMLSLPVLDASDVEAALSRPEAALVLAAAINRGREPENDPSRIAVSVSSGELLLMPSESDLAVGLKAVTVAPTNSRRGLPRIHAVYLLFDALSLTLRAVIDGTAITSLRTPAVSMAVIGPLLSRFSVPIRVLLFGAGPQATGHLAALVESGCARVEEATFVVRQPDRARRSLPAGSRVVRAESSSVPELIAGADVIVCATSAEVPLFDSKFVKAGAIVIAVGSHRPDHRELDADLMSRSDVIVEDVSTALREAGDVVLAMGDGRLELDDLIPMTEVIRGRRVLDPSRVAVFRGTGMSWQDLVIAEAIMQRYGHR